MSLFDGLFGGGAPPPTYQTNNTNPQQGLGALPPGTVIVTDNTTGISPLQNAQQAYNAARYGAGVQRGMGGVIMDNIKLMEELRNDLLPLKKWLIATYPDIYRQYQAVETLRDLGKGEEK
jgi:hypothetical protein